jgi:hypothetical protein
MRKLFTLLFAVALALSLSLGSLAQKTGTHEAAPPKTTKTHKSKTKKSTAGPTARQNLK